MKARLAEAAYQIAAKEGAGALTVRAIVERAGVSQGALLHHFSDKEAIVLATIEHTLEIARSNSEDFLSRDESDPRALLVNMMDEFRAFFFSDRFWVAIGITLEYSRKPGYSDLITDKVASLRKPVYEAWAERLTSAGWSPHEAEKVVRSGAAIVSGIAVRRFWSVPDDISDEVLGDWIKCSLRTLAGSGDCPTD